MNKQTGNIRGPGPGRPAGSPNKITGDMRAMILQAFEKAGGADWLARQANENPVAFMGLLGKLLPSQVNMDASVTACEPITEIRRTIVDVPPRKDDA
jgi:hypothetical protein